MIHEPYLRCGDDVLPLAECDFNFISSYAAHDDIYEFKGKSIQRSIRTHSDMVESLTMILMSMELYTLKTNKVSYTEDPFCVKHMPDHMIHRILVISVDDPEDKRFLYISENIIEKSPELLQRLLMGRVVYTANCNGGYNIVYRHGELYRLDFNHYTEKTLYSCFMDILKEYTDGW